MTVALCVAGCADDGDTAGETVGADTAAAVSGAGAATDGTDTSDPDGTDTSDPDGTDTSDPDGTDTSDPDGTGSGSGGVVTTGTGRTSSTIAPGSTTSTAPVDPWADAEWVVQRGDPDDPACQCADGSEHVFHTLDRDPDKVLLYYQGGGACFSTETCDFERGTYKVTTGADDRPGTDATGIFDWDHPGNPFADWSVVFVPYCSGDVFLGDAEHAYSPELTIQHRGALHAQKGLDHVVDTYPDASQLFVTGSSAGGVPTPRIGGLAADALPDTRITVLADASGGYASRPPLNAAIGELWGTAGAQPDWPELEGVDPTTIGIPVLFTLTGQHAPRVALARFDNAFDATQQAFSSLAGADSTVLDVLDENEAATEAAGVDLDVYVAPGTDHTVLGRPELWTLEVDGVAFIDWLTSLVETGDPGDVRCSDCGRPTD
jgi:hypothetical protein